MISRTEKGGGKKRLRCGKREKEGMGRRGQGEKKRKVK